MIPQKQRSSGCSWDDVSLKVWGFGIVVSRGILWWSLGEVWRREMNHGSMPIIFTRLGNWQSLWVSLLPMFLGIKMYWLIRLLKGVGIVFFV